MSNIDQAGLDQPFRCLLFGQDILEHENQQLISKYSQIVNEQFLIDGLNNSACFNCRFLVIVLSVKHFGIKSITTHCVVPQRLVKSYGSVL